MWGKKNEESLIVMFHVIAKIFMSLANTLSHSFTVIHYY